MIIIMHLSLDMNCLGKKSSFLLIVAIAVSDVDDVRPVLEHYSQFDDPIEAFKEKQRQVQVPPDL